MKRLSIKGILFAGMLGIGAVLSVLNLTGVLDDFFGGFGFGLIAVGVIRLIQLLRYRTDSDYAKKKKVELTDERNLYLANRARSLAFTIGTVLLALGVVVLRSLGFAYEATLAGCLVCGFLVLYWIVYWVIRGRS